MAYFYHDPATGSAAAAGTSWATAESAFQTALSLCSGGDTLFTRANASETTPDTAASSRTFTSPVADMKSPIKIVGVKTGTTNEGTSVVKTDFAVNTGDMPVIQATGAGNDIAFSTGDVFDFSFVKFDLPDRLNVNGRAVFYQCHITCDNIAAVNGDTIFRDCNINVGNDADTGSGFAVVTAGFLKVYGGTISNPTSQTNLCRSNIVGATQEFIGVDMSGLTITNIGVSTATGHIKLRNCRVSYTNIYPSVPALNRPLSAELIACSSATAAKTTSYQDYDYYDNIGTVSNEGTVVRTGGATDGSLGQFSYAMQLHANAGLEGTMSALPSPCLSVWVGIGAKLLTVYFVNDGSGDLNEDEIWCEFYTPNNADTADHTLTIATNTANDFAQIAEGTSAVTDDTSTWVTVNTYKQKFAKTINIGYEGWAYARVWLAKRQVSPDTVYVDPKIVVT